MASDLKVKLEVRYKGNKTGSVETFEVMEEPAAFKKKLQEVYESKSWVLRFLASDGSEINLMLLNVLRLKIRTESGKRRRVKRKVKEKQPEAEPATAE